MPESFGFIDQLNVVGSSQAGKVLTTDSDNELHGAKFTGAISPLQSQEIVFTEAEGSAAGVYTGTVQLPAGSTIIDIIIQADALWDAGTTASLIVGDTVDPDGFYTAVDLLATDLLADESLALAIAGGVEGAFVIGTLTHVTDRRKTTAAANQVIGEVTTTGTLGTAGITRMIVVYTVPSVDAAVESTFVAT